VEAVRLSQRLVASLGTVFVYAFVHHLTSRAVVATLSAIFHLGCGFVLLLSVINEDIMPATFWCWRRCCWPGCGSTRRTIGASPSWPSYSPGWLIEWRLIFPTLPALVLALAIAEGRLRYRLTMIAVLIAYILAVAGAVQLLWEGTTAPSACTTSCGPARRVQGRRARRHRLGRPFLDKAWMMLAGIGIISC